MFSQLSDKLKSAFKQLSGRGRLTESNIVEAMREVRVALLEADVSLAVTKSFVASVRAKAVGQEVLGSLTPGQAVIKVVKDELVQLMGAEHQGLNLSARPPAVVFVAGLQGAGKTTTVGKLGCLLKDRENKSVMVASADVYRPAAIEQLRILADRHDLDFFPSDRSQKPIEIATQAVDQARKTGMDVVILDTAGRLHVDEAMMDEIKALHKAVNPVETLFVVDSMTGQDAVHSAKAFNDALALTGVVLTKTDGDARGGAALSVREITGKPIKFMGTGEAMDALEPFHPDRVASRILGMGDVLSLVEEVERKVDHDQAQKLAVKLKKGKAFDLEDYREQMIQMEKMGGITSMMDKLPGMNRVPPKALLNQFGDEQTKKAVAIIGSMTPHERKFPAVLRGTRKKRVAAGSGTRIQDVNQLLRQFMQLQKVMKRAQKKGGMRGVMNQLRGNGMPGMPF